MEKIEFCKGDFPAGFRPDFDPYLFNSEEHRHLQGGRWQSYHLLRPSQKKIIASVHFNINAGLAESPHRAPFGSFQFSKRILPEAIFNFIHEVESNLAASGVKKIVIKNPPGDYAPSDAALLDVTLLNHGYTIETAEISTLLSVSNSGFSKNIDVWEKRKLRQSQRAKLKFRVIPASQLGEVYEFIKQCRDERQQTISLTRAELEKTFNALPHVFVVFGVFQDKELTAASVSIKVNKSILYNFYSAHPKKFDSLSPVVLLMDGIYKWCKKHKVRVLDLGTSALGGKPNFSLLNFKINLGGIPCHKLTFTKEL